MPSTLAYFSAEAVTEGEPAESGRPVAAIDAFSFDGPHAPGGDAVVLLDERGGLAMIDSAGEEALPAEIRQQLQVQRLRGAVRSLDVRSVHLFAVDGLSAGPDVPGLNDPLLLHGVLHGPFPGESSGGRAGTLAVTRAEFLDAFVRGLAAAFPAPAEDDSGGWGRWLHLHLPAAEEPDIERGEGTVLAYPLLRGRGRAPDEGNLGQLLLVLQELLDAATKDPSAGGSPIGSMPVPSADRGELEAQLAARGFVVEGDRATRPRPGPLGWFLSEQLELPPAGTLPDFLVAADRALSAMTDWPTSRVRAHRSRTRVERAAWVAGEPHGLVPVPDPRIGRFERDGEDLVSPPHGSSWSPQAEARLTATWRTVHFRVDPAFATWNSGRMHLDVEFVAEAPGDLSAEWEHGGSSFPAEGGGPFGAGETRQVRRLVFSNALFIGQLPNGAGFRLCLRSPGDVRIRTVTLQPVSPLPRVEPKEVPPLPADFAVPPDGGRVEPDRVRHQVGCAWLLPGPFPAPGDTVEAPHQSRLALFENGVPLGPAHCGHHLVREQGRGQYSHWGDSLLFSTSDNTDPRFNGRIYSWRIAPPEATPS